MAKARDTGAIEGEALRLSDDETDETTIALEQVLATLDESHQQARVLLYRCGKAGERDKFLRQLSPTEWRSYDMAGVLADYGGGNYRIRVYNEHTKLVRNVAIEIEEPRGGAKPRLQEAPSVIPAPAPTNNAEILTAVSQLATAMQTAMLQGFERLATTLAPKQESRGDWLEELIRMKTLFAPAGGGVDNVNTLMKMFDFVKEAMPREGESSTADVFRDLVKEFAPVLAQAAQQRGMNGAPILAAPPLAPGAAPRRPVSAGPVGAATPTPPAPTAPAPVAEPVAPVITEHDEMSLKLRFAVGFLIQKAEQGRAADEIADTVLDMLPEEMYDALAETPTPEVISHLSALDARVVTHSEWFAALHAAVKERLTVDPEPDTTAKPGATETSQ